MSEAEQIDRLIALRRDLHQHPEPAWREFYTTARLVEAIERIGPDELYIGPEAIHADARWGVPSDAAAFEPWREQAIDAGADPTIVEQLGDGHTGLVAVLDRGQGPHIALRVDIDALRREEADDPAHTPAAKGFRSTHQGAMHACGHDAHATIGVGVLEAIAASDFAGRLTVCFQPAEEEIGGGRALVASGHLDDVDHLFAIHVGLGYGTGEIVCGFGGFLAVSHLDATFHGDGAHAGAKPEAGRNAILALSAAVQNLYAITRHSDGLTRINVGEISGGSASNIIAENAAISGEVRGGTTALREFMKTRAKRVIEAAATMHGCDATVTFGAEAPSGESDPALAELVEDAAETVDAVETIHPDARFRGSEDATYLMQHVQSRGGLATFVGVGTDHPGGHHTATFDVDEASIGIGVEVIAEAIRLAATVDPDG